jgi:hypothetical protein
MHATLPQTPAKDAHELYTSLKQSVDAIISDSQHWVTDLANVASVLFEVMNAYRPSWLNWCGFYMLEPNGSFLYLGPFQGKLACTRIALGKGVVGTAAKTLEPIVRFWLSDIAILLVSACPIATHFLVILRAIPHRAPRLFCQSSIPSRRCAAIFRDMYLTQSATLWRFGY